MSKDTIYRQDAIDAVNFEIIIAKAINKETGDVIELFERENEALRKAIKRIIEDLPSAESEDWIERNKERILQAGMEGREIEFRIGGRLFAIREKAQ